MYMLYAAKQKMARRVFVIRCGHELSLANRRPDFPTCEYPAHRPNRLEAQTRGTMRYGSGVLCPEGGEIVRLTETDVWELR
jgi:hypothetical protein